MTTPGEMLELQALRREVRVEESVRDYVVRIARATREHPEIELGASPRATLALYTAAQQTADFGAPPASLAWRVAQVSRAFGRGVSAETLSTL